MLNYERSFEVSFTSINFGSLPDLAIARSSRAKSSVSARKAVTEF